MAFYTDQQVAEMEKQSKSKQALKPQQKESKTLNFLKSVKDSAISRTKSAKESMSSAGVGSGKMSFNPLKSAQAGLQVAGQAAGFVGDVVGEGIKAATPQPVKNTIKKVGVEFLKTPVGQDAIAAISAGMGVYSQWKAKNPQAAKDVESIVNIASLLPIGKGAKLAGEATSAAAKGSVRTGGKILQSVGEVGEASGKKIFESAIPLSKGEAGMVQAYRSKTQLLGRLKNSSEGSIERPVTAARTAYDTGLYGTKSSMGVQAVSKAKEIWSKTIDPALTGIKEKVDVKNLFSKVESDIKQVADISARRSRLKALSAIKDDYKNVSNLSYRQLQDIKSKLTEFIPEKAYRGENITGAYNDVRKTLSDEMRKMIYQKISPEAKRAYLDYGNLKNIQELGKTALTKAGFKGGSGTLLSEIYARASDPLKTIGGKTIGITGKKIKDTGKRLLLSAKK